MKKCNFKKIGIISLVMIMTMYLGISLFQVTYAADYAISPANKAFTDINFYKCVVTAYNQDNNANISYLTSLTDEQLAKINSLNCSYSTPGIIGNFWGQSKIESTNGIEKLVNLISLNLSGNSIKTINISNNPKLTEINVSSNSLTMLDVSKNLNLKVLDLTNNYSLQMLDVRKNTALTKLNVGMNSTGFYTGTQNRLASIDLSQNVNLTDLDVSGNRLTYIDVSKNINLINLNVSSNQLQTLDVSKNSKLVTLKVGTDSFFNIYGKNSLTTLNLRNNPNLTLLEAQNTGLTSLDVSKNLKLTTLDISSNQLTTLDVSNNTDLITLDTSSNKIKTIDVKNNSKLVSLSASFAGLTNIDVSNNLELEKLVVSMNEITEIDVSNNTKLTFLILFDNKLSSLNVKNNIYLETLRVQENNIMEIDVSSNTKLKTLELGQNNLKNIDVSNNQDLEILGISTNQLENIDVSKNVNIKSLNIKSNKIEKLDISKNVNITTLFADNNKINSLDVSKNTQLKTLNIGSNNLSSLDLNLNTKLETLDISNNKIKYIDLTTNTALKKINANFTISKYITEHIDLNNIIKIPDTLDEKLGEWVIEPSTNATIEENILKQNKIGKTTISKIEEPETSTSSKVELVINTLEITSEKYIIEGKNNFIYVGLDTNKDIIESNLKASDEDMELNVDIDNMKASITYNEEIIKEFKIINIKFKTIKIENKKLTLPSSMKYNDFINDIITNDNKINIKIYDNEELVEENKEILPNMIIKICYNDIELDTYSFENLSLFDDDLNIDEENKWILDIIIGTKVKDIIGKIKVKENIILKDKNNKTLDNEDVLGTGTKIFITQNEIDYEYSIVVLGDIDGSAKLDLQDIMKIANYKYINNKSLEGIYAKAADYDSDDELTLSDIMKLANKLYKIIS